MEDNLPLSWTRANTNNPQYKTVKLGLSGLTWITIADLPAHYSYKDIYDDFNSSFPGGFLLRGCGAELAGFMSKRGAGLLMSGMEGVVDLTGDIPGSQSVRELVNRGLKAGRVSEVDSSEITSERLRDFMSVSTHGGKPGLRHLFRNGPERKLRYFVLSDQDGNWLAMITVSETSSRRVHTELILRKKGVPPGIMEALFVSAMKTYKEEDYKYLSLGEVPFIKDDMEEHEILKRSLGNHLKEWALYAAGAMLRFAFNHKGLYEFKNKFNPEWKPVYICASPYVSLRSLADLFIETRFYDLAKSELVSSLNRVLTVDD